MSKVVKLGSREAVKLIGCEAGKLSEIEVLKVRRCTRDYRRRARNLGRGDDRSEDGSQRSEIGLQPLRAVGRRPALWKEVKD